MSGVDQRIVEMDFKGDTLLAGVKNAVAALLQLKNGLNGLKGSESDINNLDTAGKKFSLSGMANGLDSVKSKFSALSVVGIAALASITTKALDAGISIVKSLTVDPIKAGLDAYETKINAIQTILANTASEGTNLAQVTNALDQLNQYSNLTVFNFADMAKNIGTFTAAGVGLQTSVSSIKGIANLAALSGSSAEQASTGMYQLSQAIAAGSVKLQDWNSVVNAGFGGKVFQNALIETARVNGVAVDAMIKKYGSFRQSLQGGWLSAKVLTETLSEFTGDLTTSQLKAMGFTAQESAAIEKQAAIAVQSATQIRTVSQLMDALKDDVSTAWAGVWEAIIGNFQTAPKTLTSLFNTLSSTILAPINDLAKFLNSFNALGGRDIVIFAITTAFKNLGEVVSTIGAAFREVFPSSGGPAGEGLFQLALAFDHLVFVLTPSQKTLNDLKTIFVGLFSAIKIGIDVISAMFGGLTKVGSAAGNAGPGFLGLLASIAALVTKFKNLIESGDGLTKFFQFLGTVLSLPLKAFGLLTSGLGDLGPVFQKVENVAGPIVQKIGQAFTGLADAIGKGIQTGNFASIGTIINQVLLGGVLVSIKKFIKGLGEGSSGGGGLFDSIKESFESLTSTLQNMQQALKSETLEKIAIAVGLLTVSIVALSFVNVGNLAKALSAMTVMFTELLAALAIVSKVAGSSGVIKMTIIGVALNELATAILILTGAVAILSLFSWDQLAKGLSAIGILLATLAVAVKAMSGDTAGLITSAAAMLGIATALNIMAVAVGLLGRMNFGTLAKGVGTIAALLLIIVGFQKIGGGEQLVASAAGMVLIGVALDIMTIAVAKLGALSLATLAKGIGSIAVVLAILVVAMNAMDGGLPGAAAMIIAAAALLILSKALNSLGSESWASIGKALVLLAGALVLMAAAMIVMTEGLPGAAALLVMAAALAILAPILVVLGNLSWTAIVKGLAALAGVFAVVGIAGLLLAPIVPVLLGLGAAVALAGIGVLAFGAGVLVLAIGLTALSVAVVTGSAAFLAFVKTIAQAGPDAVASFAQGIGNMAKAVGAAGAAIVNAFTAVFSAVLDAITKLVPKFTAAVTAIVNAMIQVVGTDAPKLVTAFLQAIQKILTAIATYFPKFAATAVQIVTNMLNAIAGKIPAMAQAAVNLCVAFINAIGKSTVQVVTAAVKMIISVINGIANAIKQNTPALQSAMNNLGSAMINGIIAGLKGLAGALVNSLVGIVSDAINAAKNLIKSASPSKLTRDILGVPIIQGIIVGVLATGDQLNGSMVTVAQNAISSFKDALSNASDLLGDGLNLNPVITPVIDLTQAKQGLTALNGLTKSQLINVGTSASTAASISAANAAAATQAGLITGAGANLQFTQNNYSPVALSAIDIYRKTKNQISIARGVLTGNANTG